MTAQELHDVLKARFGDSIVEAKLDALQPWIRIAAGEIRVVCDALRDDPQFQFDYLMCLSGVDYNGGNLGVVYHLYSTLHKHKIVLRAACTKDQPHVQSVSDIWRTAEWHEREAYDMLGIVFDGHQDLRRILLPDDWVGHPLRKDYKVPEFYQGIKVPY
jgi:NADH-quinone oxidoreductase subunit C